MSNKFGDNFKQLRQSKGYTLGADCGNIGRVAPGNQQMGADFSPIETNMLFYWPPLYFK